MDPSELEKYLFAENKEDFIKTLVHGSKQYYFFSLLNIINQ